MPNKHTFAQGRRRNDEVCKKYSVQVSSAFVVTKLFNSTRHCNFGSLQKTKVVSASDYRAHIVVTLVLKVA